MTTLGKRAVVNIGKSKLDTDLKKSRWVWRPKGNYLDYVSKDSGSFMLKKVEAIQRSYYEDYNGGFVAFGSDPKEKNSVLFTESKCLILSLSFKLLDESQVVFRAPRKDDVYNLDFKNIVPSGGKSPSISFMRPFGCSLTILNTLDSLGKFDGKSDEGYLLGYSTSSKAFRVYNKRTKRVEENLHINFLEDQPNVAGTGYWMLGTEDFIIAVIKEKDKGPTQEYILLPLQPHRTRIPVKDVVQVAQEKPSENASPDKDIQDSEDAADKEEQHQMQDNEKDLQDELEMLVTQELVAKAMEDVFQAQPFKEDRGELHSKEGAQIPV
ncbi:ribonuclease H-like domain-containing protein [Tanacetum coccineum]